MRLKLAGRLFCASTFFLVWTFASTASEFAVGFGLPEPSDWSRQHVHGDLMKSARPWVGHVRGEWGGYSFDDLQTTGAIDKNGWPTTIPSGVTSVETLILTDQSELAKHLAGRYVLTYEGLGNVQIRDLGRVIEANPGRILFNYRPGPGSVGVRIRSTDPENPVRNIQIVKEDALASSASLADPNPIWLERFGSAKLLRFMDWMGTNGSTVRSINDLPQMTDFSFVWRSVPLEEMINLANAMHVDPWFNIPHQAEDALVRHMALLTSQKLHPDLTAHIEYSNEVWNFIFDQAHWAKLQSEELWGDVGDGWMQYYGLRAAQIMDIWSDVYDDEADQRIKRIVAVQTGWPGLEQSALFGDLATEVLGRAPIESFDAYAVTGYFGHELGNPDTMQDLLDSAEAKARRLGEEAGLSRVALREYVKARRFDGTMSAAAEMVREGSLKELVEEFWPYHAQVAQTNGLELIMYEGGTHAAADWESVENERLVSFLTEFNYSDAMGELYTEVLNAWDDVSDAPFNAFVDVAGPSKWGSWGALRHLNDDNPRWRALTGSHRSEKN